jgi:hypothetical protein
MRKYILKKEKSFLNKRSSLTSRVLHMSTFDIFLIEDEEKSVLSLNKREIGKTVV